jgi:predicted GIY-YIG superfamily endonuclease
MSKKRLVFKQNSLYIVYGIQNVITNKWYIGITKRAFEARKYQHLHMFKNNKHHSEKLMNSFRKHGIEAFTWHILETSVPQKSAIKREQQWIELFDSYENGYNMTRVGNLPFTGKKVIWDNVEYPSIKVAASQIGVHAVTLRKYIRKGFKSLDEVKLDNCKSMMWNGKSYPSVSACAREISINSSTLNTYVRKGYICDEDIPDSLRRKPIEFNGVLYPSITEAAQSIGLSNNGLANRIKRGYKGGNNKPVVWNGIEYPSVAEAARILGIHLASMSERILKGYTCDEDLGKNIRPILLNGIHYPSLGAAARALGVSKTAVSYRVSQNKFYDKPFYKKVIPELFARFYRCEGVRIFEIAQCIENRIMNVSVKYQGDGGKLIQIEEEVKMAFPQYGFIVEYSMS